VFWLKKNSVPVQKLNYLQFYDIFGYKKWKDNKIFSPPFLVLLSVPGSGMDKKDMGSGINIPDPQQWLLIEIM
jgi:hypothetical protein